MINSAICSWHLLSNERYNMGSNNRAHEIWEFWLIFHAFYAHNNSNFKHIWCLVHAQFMHVHGHEHAWTGHKQRLQSWISCAWALFSCTWSHVLTSGTYSIVKGSKAWTFTIHGHELTKEFMLLAWFLHENGMFCAATNKFRNNHELFFDKTYM